ncbi:nucleotidyltransferase [Irregularibacter muris]|uniref:tRNA(Met) cytidine acetate ligase n=1 Tax=Irregularibacter muris TaxID=1796619 RepID=A0AAE3HDL5_9FIRM|nr:nucleotidyltransferase [Irregularibacter muris]MCR1898151.1 nucleotidyltransferase [Irregularibacter muris]
MGITGLIVEYNPFHNGHQYHLSHSREVTKNEYTIAIMSGHFLQRGEPALFNKWIRTKMALYAGVDIVIELPVVFSCQSAELFAFGSVQCLEKLNVVTHLVFGSEYENFHSIESIAKILAHEPELFKTLLKNQLKTGVSFPQARMTALEKYISHSGHQDKNISSILSQPNNILAVEYTKWLHRFKSSIQPRSIKRIGSGYHDSNINTDISSATAIRNLLITKEYPFEILENLVPPCTFSLIQEALNTHFLGQLNTLSPSILSLITKSNALDLKNFMDVTEGLNNRFKKLLKTNSIDQYIDLIKTKRYTQTRIQRILCQMLLGITDEDFKLFMKNDGVQYIRVLGFNKKGMEVLPQIKRNCSLPIITNLAKSYRSLNPIQKKMMDYDILATNLYNLHFTKDQYFQQNMDFYCSPIIV